MFRNFRLKIYFYMALLGTFWHSPLGLIFLLITTKKYVPGITQDSKLLNFVAWCSPQISRCNFRILFSHITNFEMQEFLIELELAWWQKCYFSSDFIWFKHINIIMASNFSPPFFFPLQQSITDTFESFTLNLLSSLLVSGPNSPFYKALIESGLGTDFSPDVG